MNYYDRAINTLEYNKIVTLLADSCCTEGAKKMALSLLPEGNPDSVRKNLALTTDAKKMLTAKGLPPFDSVYDITDAMERAAKGGTLTMSELLRVAYLMSTSRRLYEYCFGGDGDGLTGGMIEEHFARLHPDRMLEDKIRKAILADDMMSDEASPLLADIRRKIRLENAKIRDNLQKYAGGQFGKYLQENIVTIRNGRYVVPVKAEYKNEVKGLVHDTSSSGATYFIEPLAIVDSNNELRSLESKEEHEIERILSALTSDCCMEQSAIDGNYRAVTYLAFLFGKAELSVRMRASEPEISRSKSLRFINARHPLIPKERVVPITVSLGESYDTMIITGPNTGGKTVTLKTLGLLSLMAQAGLHIPADEGSQICIFDSVLADIGDEQSIEQNLSTFSAHMVNTVDILSKLTDESLALFDELGAGTDPTEGAALAAAIIENVRERGALCAATTHYTEIKAFAIQTPGVTNASCEFDVETLRPTYRLIIGTPGKSNAFAISRKLGLDGSIIERAQLKLTTDDLRFEDLLQELETKRKEAETDRKTAEALRASYEAKYSKLEKEIEENRRRSEKELEKSKEQAARILESARATEEYVLADLDKIRKQKDSERFGAAIEEGRKELRRRIDSASDAVNPVVDEDSGDYVLPRPIQKGDTVYITNLKLTGTVIQAPDRKGSLSVRTGNVTTRTTLKYIRLKEEAVTVVTADKKKVPVSKYQASITASFSPELDIRGLNGDEGWDKTDKYLDDACMASMKTVTIIHGKGSGVLRKIITSHLDKDKRVKSYRGGLYGEGDSGVTVVELK